MKAVVISPHPGVNMGGVERFCILLEQLLRQDGWETASVGPEIEVPISVGRLGVEPTLSALSASAQARRARPDLVISNGYLGGPTGTRRIHVLHGTMVRQMIDGGTGRRRYRVRRALSGVPAELLSAWGATVVSVSASTADEFARIYRRRVDAVIPNGIDTDLFAPGNRLEARSAVGLDPEGRYALFVGRLEYRKGADLLPQACRRAGYELVVAGPDSPPTAIALGTLAPEQLAAAYRAADCVVFPTRYEACSYVVLEALASGVPLVTTTAGWMAGFVGQCPAYQRLIVSPTADSVTATLQALPSLDLDQTLRQAREFIVSNNSLAAFGSSWLELTSKVMAS